MKYYTSFILKTINALRTDFGHRYLTNTFKRLSKSIPLKFSSSKDGWTNITLVSFLKKNALRTDFGPRYFTNTFRFR